MSAPFSHEDPRDGKWVELYYEDEYVALNTFDEVSCSSHEILLDPPAVEAFIEALTKMQATLRTRYQKAITA